MGARRWKILFVIGVLVVILDQWSKILVVKHLTPGMLQEKTNAETTLHPDRRKEALESITPWEAVQRFYGTVRSPCKSFGARCPTVPVIDGFWNWRYVENPGAAWGLLAGAGARFRVPFFILISIAAIGFILSFVHRLHDEQLLLNVALSLVFGGAIGNFIDRLHLSYVVDFVDWYIGSAHWPTFNVADAAITTGVCLMVIEWIRDGLRSPRESPS